MNDKTLLMLVPPSLGLAYVVGGMEAFGAGVVSIVFLGVCYLLRDL